MLFCIQSLPGPTSTQLVVSTALARAGPIGGLTAFFLWNLPGLIVLTVCGVLIASFVDENNPPWYLIGLPPAAISLVFKAFYGFGLKLDKLGIILCLISSLVAVMINGSRPQIDPLWSQYIYPSMLACGGVIAYIDSIRGSDVNMFGKTIRVPGTPYGTYKSASKGWDAESDLTMRRIGIPIWVGALIWIVWAIVLAITVSLVGRMRKEGITPNPYLEIFEVMYRIGSLIFGGGQVVLPMLQTEVVPMWMKKDAFLQGLVSKQRIIVRCEMFRCIFLTNQLGYFWILGPCTINAWASLQLLVLPRCSLSRSSRSSCCLYWFVWARSYAHLWNGPLLGSVKTRKMVQICFEWCQCYCYRFSWCCLCDSMGGSRDNFR